MKRAALIVLIAILTGFLFEHFVFTSRRSVNNVGEPGVKTEGRKADEIAPAKDSETRKELTARLQFPPGASSADRTSETIQGVTEAPYPHAVTSLRSPSDFPELPQDFGKLLIGRGCQIPEYSNLGFKVIPPKTVISGDFAQSGQTDWAVICQKDDQSSIVVFWAKPTGAECDPELEKSGNRDYHESIRAVSSSEILERTNPFNEGGPDFTAGAWMGPSPPPEYPNISHSGIAANNANKEFRLSYCSQGHWYHFQAVGE